MITYEIMPILFALIYHGCYQQIACQYLQIEVPLIVFVIKKNCKPTLRQTGVTEAQIINRSLCPPVAWGCVLLIPFCSKKHNIDLSKSFLVKKVNIQIMMQNPQMRKCLHYFRRNIFKGLQTTWLSVMMAAQTIQEQHHFPAISIFITIETTCNWSHKELSHPQGTGAGDNPKLPWVWPIPTFTGNRRKKEPK